MNASNSKTSSSPVIWIAASFLLLVIGGLIIAESVPLITPPQASAESAQVDNLFKVLLAIGGAIFLLVQGAIVFSVIRFRAKQGDDSDGAAMHGNPTLELVWTAIPAVIVLILSLLSFQVWVSITSAKDNEMLVETVGSRFNWSFSYEVPDEDITVNSRTLHTYVGQPVRMTLQSTDVNHAFWIPAMRIKQDLLPGYTTEVRFTPTLPGEYPVVCAELCGGGHGDMRATVMVHPDEETYLAWFNEEVDVLLNPPEDPTQRGQQVLASGAYPCAGCHILEDLNWTGVTGPNLEGVGDRASQRVPGLTAEEYLVESLYHPADFLVPGFGPLMPQFVPDNPDDLNYMPADEAQAIVAYLCTQTSTGESACDLENLASITVGSE